MLYYNAENTKVFLEAINCETSKLGVNLVRHDLDRMCNYNTNVFQSLEHLIEEIVKDMRDWFSSDNLTVKEMNVCIHNTPWDGEFICIQRRCKR